MSSALFADVDDSEFMNTCISLLVYRNTPVLPWQYGRSMCCHGNMVGLGTPLCCHGNMVGVYAAQSQQTNRQTNK